MAISMKPIHLTNLGQKGSTLLEALVALLLTSIIALGGALSIGKILKTQHCDVYPAKYYSGTK